MKSILFFLGLMLCWLTGLFAQSHIPVPHNTLHGTDHICWGYAMGLAGGKSVGDGTCNPMTSIPNDATIDGTYFTQYSWSQDKDLLQEGDILYWAGTHAMYVTSAPKSGGHLVENSITVTHTATAWPTYYNDDFTTAKGRGGLALGDPGFFYRKKNINVTAQNLFYNGSSTVTNQGTIALDNSSGTSPYTTSMGWTGSHTATATDNQNYPTGYRQIFNTSTGWTQSGAGKGTTLQISIQADASQGAYQANFYQAVGVTFYPYNGGGITVDGQTQYNSFTKYARLTTPVEQVNATAVNATSTGIYYYFSHWTNSGNSDTSYSFSISFYPSSAVTYTANFNAKPLQAANVYAGGTVGNPVQITWNQHPYASVTYKIYRKVKPLGGSTSSETLIASLSNATTSYTDYEYTVTSTYTDDLLSYDVRSYLTDNGTYSDPNFVQVFGRQTIAFQDPEDEYKKAASLPTQYGIASYPNPFNPSTTISYQLVEEASVTLEIYDVMGRKISSLLQEQKQAGYYTAKWEGKDNSGKQVATGAYLYRFSAVPTSGKQPFAKSGKLLLTK